MSLGFFPVCSSQWRVCGLLERFVVLLFYLSYRAFQGQAPVYVVHLHHHSSSHSLSSNMTNLLSVPQTYLKVIKLLRLCPFLISHFVHPPLLSSYLSPSHQRREQRNQGKDTRREESWKEVIQRNPTIYFHLFNSSSYFRGS